MADLNIEEIMKEIQRNSRDKRYQDVDSQMDDVIVDTNNLKALEFDSYEFEDNVFALNGIWKVKAVRPLTGNLVKRLLKRFCRRLVLFFVEEIVDDQNTFNASTVRLMNQLNCYVEEVNSQREDMMLRIKELESQVNQLNHALEEKNESSNN